MVNIYVAVTDKQWFDFLSSQRPEEVNFWKPSDKNFKAISQGDIFLFKLKGSDNVIAGGGVFQQFSNLPLSIAWEMFDTRNGCKSEVDLRYSILNILQKKNSSRNL